MVTECSGVQLPRRRPELLGHRLAPMDSHNGLAPMDSHRWTHPRAKATRKPAAVAIPTHHPPSR